MMLIGISPDAVFYAPLSPPVLGVRLLANWRVQVFLAPCLLC